MNGIGARASRLSAAAARRLARWSAHPYLTLIIAAAVTLTLVDGLANRGMSDLVAPMTALIALLVAETYWWPASSALAIVVTSMAVVVAPRVVLPIPVWALWYAYGMLAYRRRYATLAVTLLLGIAGTVTGVLLDRYPLWNMSSIVSLDGSFVLAAIVGVTAAERHKVEQARRLAEENARMRRDIELGSRIHDSVTQGLTVIALTGERLRGELAGDGGRDAETREAALRDVGTIVAAAETTLTQARAVIDALGGSTVGDGAAVYAGEATAAASDSAVRGRLAALRETARDGDERLHALGFAGCTTVGPAHGRGGAADDAGRIDAAADRRLAAMPSGAWRELGDLLGQLVTNVIVHADPFGGDYAIDVTIDADAVTLTQSNAIRPDVPDAAAVSDASDAEDGPALSLAPSVPRPPLPHSGRGLALHRRRLEALGGGLRASAEDGAWILVARIPLEERADAAATVGVNDSAADSVAASAASPAGRRSR
ncbi:hypothetical protein G1C96_1577 [Bifidobacterium sp. DSM 109958]|uniref:Histidine kinase n=1 Tax=Bifidobacterium moraviense TaxID=2675323 RepID=A0A7Y0F2S8_9BIFI|nr:histidine kinase [Bifidobacterium sp. DSM 109958]NMN00995.1 hypothetical protein [Bifidobacterium sp. DSM 109958]